MKKRAIAESLLLSSLVLMGSSGTLGFYFFGIRSGWVWVPFGVGFIILILSLVVGFTDFRRGFSLGHSFFWILASAKGAVLLTILALVNLGLFQKRLYWDATERQVFSLSEQSISIAQGIKEPIVIKAFYAAKDPERAVLEELVLRYQQYSEKISFETHDPAINLNEAKKLNIQPDGARVILLKGNKGRISEERVRLDMAAYDHEAKMTGALLRLDQPQKKSIYFLVGHGERSFHTAGPTSLSLMKSALEAEGYRVNPLSLIRHPSLPKDAAAVVLAGPLQDLLPAEIELIDGFLAQGGRVGIALEPGQDAALNGFLGRYGIHVNRDMVIDRSEFAQMYGEGPTAVVAVSHPTAHPITQPLRGSATLFPGASSISIVPGGEGQTFALVQSGPRAWGERSLLNEKPDAQLRWEPGEAQGPITLMVGNQTKESRLWLSSDVDFMTDAYFDVSGNKNLFLNAIGWLADVQSNITLRPHARGHHRILLSAKQKEGIAFLLVYLWPLMSLFLGIWVSRYRNNRSGALS